jgi:hypothetical protein
MSMVAAMEMPSVPCSRSMIDLDIDYQAEVKPTASFFTENWPSAIFTTACYAVFRCAPSQLRNLRVRAPGCYRREARLPEQARRC